MTKSIPSDGGAPIIGLTEEEKAQVEKLASVLTKAQLAEEAFPQAKYKHAAKQLQISIKKWMEQNSTYSKSTSQ